MRASRSNRLILTLSAIALGLMMLFSWSGNRKYRGVSRIKTSIRNPAPIPDYNNGWSSNDYEAIDNFLNSRKTRLALANAVGVDANCFAFQEFSPVRGTRLYRICYCGSASNVVQSATSNAARMVVTFITTNHPSFEVSFIDSYCEPISFWKRF